MRKTIAISMLGLALVSNGAAAQTAVEQSHILGEFQRSVVDYTQQHKCFELFPEALNAASPAPKIFTLPVAMVFRQLIARAVTIPDGPAINGTAASHRAVVLQPFPENELTAFPRVLNDALPSMPAPLEYRLIGNDLVIRDAAADVIVAVLRDALGAIPTR